MSEGGTLMTSICVDRNNNFKLYCFWIDIPSLDLPVNHQLKDFFSFRSFCIIFAFVLQNYFPFYTLTTDLAAQAHKQPEMNY